MNKPIELLQKVREHFRINLSGYTSVHEVDLLHEIEEFFANVEFVKKFLKEDKD